MIQRNLLFALIVGALLLPCSCSKTGGSTSKTGGSTLAEEVLSVPILIENGFEWHNRDDEAPDGGRYIYSGGSCVVPLPMSEAVDEVQKTLTPENGWTRSDNPSMIGLAKADNDRQEAVAIYFTIDPRTRDTLVSVQQ